MLAEIQVNIGRVATRSDLTRLLPRLYHGVHLVLNHAVLSSTFYPLPLFFPFSQCPLILLCPIPFLYSLFLAVCSVCSAVCSLCSAAAVLCVVCCTLPALCYVSVFMAALFLCLSLFPQFGFRPRAARRMVRHLNRHLDRHNF